QLLRTSPAIEPAVNGNQPGAIAPFSNRRLGAVQGKIASDLFFMSSPKLERLLANAAQKMASDLHLIAGVPPAFRINGEIILANEDVLSAVETREMVMALLSSEQQEKFEQDWELCISLLHSAAGRVRVTFYKRNGHPEMSLRFCGE